MSNQPTLISLNAVCEATSLSRTMVNRLRRAGSFPAAVKLGDKRVCFVKAEVERWIQAKIAARDATAAKREAAP